jgi:expansin (peptidoglycan-binding protein)
MNARLYCPILVALVVGCSSGGDPAGTKDAGPGADGAPSNDASSPGSDGAVQTTTGDGGVVLYGSAYQGGQYNLGPVDYAETQWHNACAPGTKYAPAVQSVEGNLLAGLWDGIPNVAGYCDACIFVTTDKGKSSLLRVVTYGSTSANSIDVSPEAYQILDSGEYPRSMTWQFAECPDTGPMMYEFQTGSSQWWTSLWVRNARVPIAKVEVQSPNHAQWTELQRGSDGTLTDAAGFGQGTFSIRTTGIDNTQVVDTFQWPSAGIAGQMLTGAGNFP